MKLSGISIKMFAEILLELWKYFEKYTISSIFCWNKFHDKENFEKVPCKRWKNFRVTSEKFWLNLKNRENILKKCEGCLRTKKFVKY